MPTSLERRPWDRQPGDTDAAWRAFQSYRDLGPDRTLDRAYQHRYGHERASAAGHFREWARHNAWVDRTRAYDAFIEQQARAEQERVWVDRALGQANRTWDLAQQLRTKAEEMARYPLTRQRTERDGHTIVIEPARWTFRDARAIAETADKLERLATGEPNVRSELSGPGGTPLLEALNLTALDPHEKTALLTLLRKARDARDGE